MTIGWVGMFTLTMQQKVPRVVMQINHALPAGTPDIISNSCIICQGDHFSQQELVSDCYFSVCRPEVGGGEKSVVVVVLVSQFNGTSTPKGSYSAKTGDNDCNVNSSRYSLSIALCESNSLSGQV